MLVDMHLHECTYSTDSFLHLEEIVSIPIFVGVEFFSLWGDITAWGIDGIPDQRVSAQDFIDLVREKDGFCVSCHPFRSNNRGLREHLRDVHGLDGAEVLNGSTPLEENRTALRFCRELGLKAIGASDASFEMNFQRAGVSCSGPFFTFRRVISDIHAEKLW